MLLRLALQSMGTRFELVLCGDSERDLRAAGEDALREIEDGDRRWSLFRRDSVLAHVNRCAARGWTAVDADTFELLELAGRVHAASGGAFDPSVAPRMRALGLQERPGATAPNAPVGWHHVQLDGARRAVRFARAGVELDLGGIAKGFALDLAARALRGAGVERALLHGGTSTALALGAPPGAQPWQIAIGPDEGAPVVPLAHAALSVSSPAGRRVEPREEHGGRTIGHVLDPQSGGDVPHARRAAVIAPAAGVADAWSTALLVEGARPPADLEVLLGENDGTRTHWQRIPRKESA